MIDVEICNAIKQAIPIWNNMTDEEISRRCSLYDNAYILVCNKGYTPNQAVQKIIKDDN